MKILGTKAKATGNRPKDKFIRCVRNILGKTKNYNPYAVCRNVTKYKGTSHNIGLLKPRK